MELGVLAVRAIALAAALSTAACSFAFTRKVAPTWEPSQPPDCSTSPIPPALDLVPPTAAVVAVATGVLTEDVDLGGEQLRQAIAIGVILASTPWLASSIYGFYHTTRCRRARRDHGRWIQRWNELRPETVTPSR